MDLYSASTAYNSSLWPTVDSNNSSRKQNLSNQHRPTHSLVEKLSNDTITSPPSRESGWGVFYDKIIIMKESLVIAAVIMAIIGNIPYLIDIIKKKIKPHPYTWFIWSIVSAVTFFGALVKGGGIGVIPTATAEIFTIIIFLFSLQYGFKHVRKIDHYFLALALLGLIPWILTKDPTISVITVVSIDFIAFIPTLIKTYKDPKSEKSILYEMNVTRHILTLLTLQTHNIATSLHSIVMILLNSLMSIFINRKSTPSLPNTQ